MPAVTSCPDQHVLRQFALGQLAPEEVERLASHVERCMPCTAAITALRADDTLVASMRNSSVVDQPNPKVDGLIDRLCKVKPPAPDMTAALPASASSSASAVESGERTEIGAEAYDFLALAKGPGEIGWLGNYRILKVLGAGGMGVVFQAEDTQLKRIIALKTMRPAIAANATSRQRFLREAQAAALLESDYIVPIYQVGEDRGVPYLAMPFLKGTSLDDRLKKGAWLKVQQVVRIGIQTAKGLAAAHEAGLIHRDIKPANIWIEPEGGGRAKILDFGLARSSGEDSHLTQSGSIVGTPAYMAPEQARGEKLDGRCDLFSLGCVLYRMLTGVQPFQGAETMATLVALAMHNPPPPLELNPSLPPALSGLVIRLLSKDPAGRPATAKVVIDELQGIERTLARPESGTTSSPASAPVRPRTRSRLMIAGAALLVVGLLAGIIFRITRKDGKVEDIELKPGDKFEIVEKKDDKKPAAGTLDALDAAKIPAEERFPWQPKELVAVLGEHRGRHWGQINSLSFSPDGKTIACAGHGSVIPRLLDAATLREKALLSGTFTSKAVFSPDGKTLVSAVGGDGVWLWDISGSEPKKLVKLAGISDDVAYSHDGKTLAASFDTLVQLWDLRGDKPRERPGLKGLKPRVIALALSPDGSALLTMSDYGKKLQLWDLSSPEPKERAVLEGHTAEVLSAAFSHDGKTLATGAHELHIRLWDLTGLKPKQRGEIKRHISSVLALAPDGKTLAVGTHLHEVRSRVLLFDLTGGEPFERGKIEGSGNVQALAFSPDGKTLATGNNVGVVKLWDVTGKEPQEKLPLKGPGGPLASPRISRDGKTLATYDAGNVVWVWDLSGAAPLERIAHAVDKQRINGFALSPDGKTVVTGGDGLLRMWDVKEASLSERGWVRTDAGPTQFAPDGQSVACLHNVPDGHVIKLWDVTGEEPKEKLILPKSMHPFTFSADGKTLACRDVGKGTQARIWDIGGAAPKERATIDIPSGETPSLSLTPDGKTLAWGNYYGVFIWDVGGVKPEQRMVLVGKLPDRQTFTTVVLSPDGKSLAAICGTSVTVWDMQKLLNPIGLKLPDGSLDGEKARFLMDKAEIRTWKFPGSVNHLTFAPDGRHLITANANGTAYVLRLSPAPGN